MFKELKNIFKQKDKQAITKTSKTQSVEQSTSKDGDKNVKSTIVSQEFNEPVKMMENKNANVSPKTCENAVLTDAETIDFEQPKRSKDITFNTEDITNTVNKYNDDAARGKVGLHNIASRNTEATHLSSIVSLDSSWVDDDSAEEGEYDDEEEEDDDDDRSIDSPSEAEDESVDDQHKARTENTKRHYHRNIQHQPQTLKFQRTLFDEQCQLSDYLLLEKIGEGAFSKVYKCVRFDMNQIYENINDFEENEDTEYFAVKVINKEMLASTDNKKEKGKFSSKEQVLKEIMIHKLVSNRITVAGSKFDLADELKQDIDTNPDDGSTHIVKFVDFHETESYYYIIQELLSGGEIFGEVVKYTYFSEDLSRFVVRQLTFAIKHLHSLGVVHRDIKLENLLFETIPSFERNPNKNDPPFVLRKSDDPKNKMDEGIFIPGVGAGTIGIVKLADFGLSKKVVNMNAADLSTPCGTVGYTAPEVVKDERYSFQVDLWGIGCVLYTVLCGFPPFYDEKNRCID